MGRCTGLDGVVRFPEHLTDFAGQWRVERRINDRKTGQILTGQGAVDLTQITAGHLRYSEQITLTLPNAQPLEGRRTYEWHGHESGWIEVSFDDDRPFHRIRMGQAVSTDDHWCAPDTYAARYDFSVWPIWSAVWTVAGPHKNYVSQTWYRHAIA